MEPDFNLPPDQTIPPIDPAAVPGETPPAATPAPQYATLDAMKAQQEKQDQVMATLQQQNTELMSTLNTVLGNQVPAQTPLSAPVLTGKDIDEMITNGEGGDKILSHFDQMMDNKITAYNKAVVDPMRSQGTASISTIAKQNAKNTLPYYDMFASEIDDYLGKLDPSLRANPEIYKFAHDTIVGQNVGKVMKLEQEKKLRADQENDITHQQTPGTNRPGGGNDEPGKVQPPEEFFDARGLQLLADQKITAEQHAQKMGFKDYDAMWYYSKQIEDPRDAAALAAKAQGAA